ncbi:T7SS effector LXG polymorphic toxin [Bacillus sp. MHSD_36]|uniref:T7SS effector LXG polymorphic toxin n=1 Tax=unclassified Bacillus (in: firmicutes) TaxID=185979 RepID=UPI00274245D6|nr:MULTISPECIES: T7SS effector LXG polymorphic toxin [unclassified Bacillus (in: firmicutes)]MDP7990588.1 T7SS effector LXG polymorphic toxin [Bacillus sp. MHSD_36]MDR4978636.1 T7SS effector LXG polymorphic toxin [Bacillus sp. MHSD_37]
MSLNMYLGEVQAQTESMNAFCNATIQGMEQIIHSINAFALDTVLQGQTYSSAKAYFLQTFRPLAQGIIYLCEELIRQNDAFPRDFQSQVASRDVIEQEILEQIREIDRMIASTEALNQTMPIPGMDAMVNLFTVMRQKLQEKLEHLYEFNYTSSNNYDTALQLAASIATGLAEVQSGKGFSPVSGTFSTQGLNMEWITSIQQITEETAREAEIKKEIEEIIALREQEANRPWYEKTAIGTWEFMKEFFQGAGSAAFESVIGLESPDNDELESKLTYQAGRFMGNVIAGAASIIEILEGLTVIGGSNFLTLVATVGTGGLASPIAITFDAAATTAGVSLVGHGVFVGRNAIQNGKDTLQKIQSSSSGSVSGVKGSSETAKNLLKDGKFIESDLELRYKQYCDRKAKEGKVPKDRLDWKEASDYWTKNSPMARGNRFNSKAREEGWYDYHELHLENHKRLDSYDPIFEEIVSRKATDLHKIDEATFRTYLNEFRDKYSSGTKIRSNQYPELDGLKLNGDYILEVPASNKNIKNIEKYKEIAEEYGVTLRFREE